MLKQKLHNARLILSTRGWVVVVALAWLVATVSVGNVVPLISSAEAQTTQSDPEVLRAALRDILETQLEAAAMLGSTDIQETIAQTLEQLDQLTWEDLVTFDGLEGQLSDLQAKQAALYDQLEVVEGYVPNLADVVQQSSQFSSAFLTGKSGELTGAGYIGLTNAGYGALCTTNPFGDPPGGPNRSGGAFGNATLIAITISDILLVNAERIRDLASVICNETIVALGFGGNPQNVACLVSEIIYNGFKTTNSVLKTTRQLNTFCDAAIDSAEIEGAYERAADIYDQNVDIDADLAAHDSDLAAHDTDIKALLATLQAEVDENQLLLRDAIQLLNTPEGVRNKFPIVE